ncbi:MAG: hypothetical protein Q7S74_01360 [Nanoarchaeota archaeon]|nr:hypothetical protein [Nanoarchaeota archaeon]
MKKEMVVILAQLLTGIKDAMERIEEAQRNKDAEELAEAKLEILRFQKKIDELL